MTDKKTRSELKAIAQEAFAGDGFDINGWDSIVDALLEATGYKPAPEPPTYPEGTISRVTDDVGIVTFCTRREGRWYYTIDDIGRPMHWVTESEVTLVEPLHTYDPSESLVIPLDSVPHPIILRQDAVSLEDNGQLVLAEFLRTVADLAEKAREAGK